MKNSVVPGALWVAILMVLELLPSYLQEGWSGVGWVMQAAGLIVIIAKGIEVYAKNAGVLPAGASGEAQPAQHRGRRFLLGGG